MSSGFLAFSFFHLEKVKCKVNISWAVRETNSWTLVRVCLCSPPLWTLDLKDEEGSLEGKQERQEQQVFCAHLAQQVKDENTDQYQEHSSTFQVSMEHGHTARGERCPDLGRSVGMWQQEGEEPVGWIWCLHLKNQTYLLPVGSYWLQKREWCLKQAESENSRPKDSSNSVMRGSTSCTEDPTLHTKPHS